MSIVSPISRYLDRFSAGDVDGAFFGLLELDHSIVEDLVAAYSREEDIQRRAFLLRVISEYRQQSCIPFLAACLSDENPKIWRQALDGFVSIASPAALEAMRAVRNRSTSARIDRDKFGIWLDEAISQISRDA